MDVYLKDVMPNDVYGAMDAVFNTFYHSDKYGNLNWYTV